MCGVATTMPAWHETFRRKTQAQDQPWQLAWLARFPRPIRKLSGLMSRWMKLLLCTNSIREICSHPARAQALRSIQGGTPI